MAKFRTELPLTAMNRKLIRASRNLRKKTLLDRIELMLRAKLMTQEEADEIKARLSPEELAAVPARGQSRVGTPSADPS